MNGRGIRDQMAILQGQNKQLGMQNENMLRLLMQLLIEHGGAEAELTISHVAANSLALQRSAIDTLPGIGNCMTIRYRDTVLRPTPNVGPVLVAAGPVVEEDPEEDAAPPCSCTHGKSEHVAGIGNCRLGSCPCGQYDPVVAYV